MRDSQTTVDRERVFVVSFMDLNSFFFYLFVFFGLLFYLS
jgi:hypothetical protein